MKKSVFILAAGCVLFAANTNAQTTPNVAKQTENVNNKKKMHLSPEERAKKSVTKLDEIVQLTQDQKNKIYDLSLNKAKSVDAVMEKYKGQTDKKEQAKEEIRQIRKKYREEVKNILTPEQIEKLKAYHQAHHPKTTGKPEDMIPEENENR